MPSAQEHRRREAIRLFEAAPPGRQRVAVIARRLGVSGISLRKWVRRYQTEGLAGLKRKSGAGRRGKLTAAQWQQLLDILRAPRKPREPAKRWTAKRLQRLIHERFGVQYHVWYLPQLLHRHGWSYDKQGPRRRMPTICLACCSQPLERSRALNALSRFVVACSICSDCGVREAFQGFFWKPRAESLGLPIGA